MIRALYFTDLAELREKRQAGSIHASPPDSDNIVQLWYCCPCGCGYVASLTVGVKCKPTNRGASWNWNGSETEATLTPSVNHVRHWHGWLRDGYWEAC